MALFKIKKGQNLSIGGELEAVIERASQAKKVALLPTDFAGIKWKLEVGVGDVVKIGSPLLASRLNPDLKLTSPGGGKVIEINRGDKRKLLEIVVEIADEEESREFETFTVNEIPKLERGSIVSTLLDSGLWSYLIQRPFSRIANPSALPKSIFINAMDTEPNCADKQLLIKNSGKSFEAGIEILKKLTEGKVYLCYDGNAKDVAREVITTQGVETHQFKGNHPAGNVGTHISKLDPIKKGDTVWHIDAEHLVLLGRFFLEGKIPTERIIAVGGTASTNRKYFKTRLGAPIEGIVQGKVTGREVRYISGGVLAGEKTNASAYLNHYRSTLTLIPEGHGKELAGWMKLGTDKPSLTRLFISSFLPPRKFTMNTKVNGEPRAIVATHIYDPLVALNVYTNFLVKACMAKDIERMEELGILECAPEDFSLCTYACISKIEVDSIIKEGLELVEKES